MKEPQAEKPSGLAIPSLALPKGGGAIRGIGEKFATNPTTGTGAMTVPITLSPGRSGFQPELSLAYDSGAGNGVFGLGWNISLASITRKTDKGLPRYHDDPEADVFILSGVEDLVPVYRQGVNDPWVKDAADNFVIHEDLLDGYRVRRYRPRLEGLFARIERWTLVSDPHDVHWRSITKDNLLSIYGGDSNSRVSDPTAPGRIFSWLLCETRDDKGNGILYRYKAEDGVGINPGKASERNRGASNDPRRTANRYLKTIYYGNRTPLLDAAGSRPRFLARAQLDEQIANAGWMFEVVFDYGEHDEGRPRPDDAGAWDYRVDPFSTYRAGFEVRTTRRCKRVLMFHHFPEDPAVGVDCLVRSTDFFYSDAADPADSRNPVYTFLRAVAQTGYRRNNGGYERRSLPTVEFEYTQPVVQDSVQEVAPESLANLPVGLDGTSYQWNDLYGEGIPGLLTEQAGAWFYKRNLSPRGKSPVEFGAVECVAARPNVTLNTGNAQFMDLAGDGQPDLVVLGGPTPGRFEQDDGENWRPFQPFTSWLNRDWQDPNLKFVDLDGDGHADVLITEDDAFVWHPSLGEEGFGPARRLAPARDEEKGPRLVFADDSHAIFLADLSGDGLTDLVRIRNGEICYWPNLGYGRFGAKITMDNAPWFDQPDQFDQSSIRLADIDGSGATDIIYLHRDGVRLYFNQGGNGWSTPQVLRMFPRVDEIASITPIDLFGNGTACLVWSSPLPGESRRPMRYVDLMGGQKPHLLVRITNNLGAETRVHYAPSTQFYLQDKRDGRPWITKLPFPVHVVEKVETFDWISRSRFVTRYAYHHGYFDGVEREFRGFGMIEQWDTEQFAALAESETFPASDNVASESHMPPVHTKTWFHTGIYLGRENVSDFFAGLRNSADPGEYFREPGLSDAEARALLLSDTVLLPGMTFDEERQACRGLKGQMLRQEIYALDGSDREQFPYTVTEQNFTIRPLQPQGANRHGVFFTHPRESLTFHYERNPADPRIQQAFTLEVDERGNILKSVAIGYGRRATLRTIDVGGNASTVSNPALASLSALDRSKQTTPLATYSENRITHSVEATDSLRGGLPCETVTYELTGYAPTGPAGRFQSSDFVESDPNLPGRLRQVFSNECAYEETPTGLRSRRLVELTRTLYRKDDLTDLLPLGQLESLGLPGETYQLAFTPGLLAQVFQRPHSNQPAELLMPNPAAILAGQSGDRGGYVQSQTLKADGRFPASDANDAWWIPSGRSFLSADPADNAPAERLTAQQHFFLGRRYRDPFGQDTTVSFDPCDLLIVDTRDALGNRVTVDTNDYRVLQPSLISDPNRNRVALAFDALGQVVGTAVMGKPAPATIEGDSLNNFSPDLPLAQLESFHDDANPAALAAALLQNATSRIVYDLDRFSRTQKANPNDPTQWLPPCTATFARETHVSDPLPPQGLKLHLSFAYSDGFGREIQKKLSAEPGPIVAGGPVISPRWVGSGWTIFNNKGQPVRQYESFFSGTPHFEFGVQAGVSPVLFYDPIGRVIATLYPNHSYVKAVFDPWQQTAYDANDTCAARNLQTGDLRTDPDIAGLVERYFAALPADPASPWETWREQRIGGALGEAERTAAIKAAAHADTPTTAHFDPLGRSFLTIARNRVVCANHPLDGTEDAFTSRLELDIKGNTREVRDASQQAGDLRGRIVMRYASDMTDKRIYQQSMEAGALWRLNDIGGNPIRRWDDRGHNFTHVYDALRRPLQQFVRGTTVDSDPRTFNADLLIDRIEYGETLPNAVALNLRQRVFRHWDSAGIATSSATNPNTGQTEAYDFKGNLLRSSRQLVSDYKAVADWSQSPALDPEIFTGSSRYNALNFPVQKIAPHRSSPGAQINVIQPTFNEANLLERMEVWLGRPVEPDGLLNPAVDAPSSAGVSNVDYDAKGQRQRIDYKNGASTLYEYDPQTFRLARLQTRRGAAAFPSDNPQPPATGWPGGGIQDLSYVYDPVGNIIHLQDDAQQSVYFNNRRVEPSSDYIYDALYRLIEATGREHLGQNGAGAIHSFNDAERVGVASGDGSGQFSGSDGNAMGAYLERYVYDAVGNFLAMQHRRTDAASPGWTRDYTYSEASLIENGAGGSLLKTSNRLSSTTVGGNVEAYGHDAHGNMLRLPHLGAGAPGPNLHWDYNDQLSRADLGGGGTAHCIYDAAGQRVRKVWEKSAAVIEERIYLGGFEIFRRHRGAIGVGTATLERETLHVMDDVRRIALVETRTLDLAGDDPAPAQLVRYQLCNHLGSASVELDAAARIVSYEEYTPYGSSSYQAVRNQTDTPKRYRYAGKERDDETGLAYHEARYYAPWLGRWAAADPSGIGDGLNLYVYGHDNPIVFVDPNGNKNIPSNNTDTEIKDMTDPQLHQKLQGMSKLERGTFATTAQGWFASRAWATLTKYNMEWEVLAPPAATTTPYVNQGPPTPDAPPDPPAEDDPTPTPSAGDGTGGMGSGTGVPDYSGSIMPDGTGSTPLQVFVYNPKADKIGGFMESVAENYEYPISATNWEDAMKSLTALEGERGPIHVLYIMDHAGHGCSDDRPNCARGEINQIFGTRALDTDDYRQLAPLLAPEATVVLGGCGVAFNLEEVKKDAEALSATVVSNTSDTWWHSHYFETAGEWVTTNPSSEPDPTYTARWLGLK